MATPLAAAEAKKHYLDVAYEDRTRRGIGPLFRPINKAGTVSAERLTDRSVANLGKAYAGRAGLDAKLFSGHSLRIPTKPAS
ncbi:hypothetical protein ACVWZV_000951 [Bradyrhizobium sp. GM5.1]